MAYALKRLSTSCLVCLVIACFVLPDFRGASAADKRRGGATQVARLGREFKLRVGQRADLKEGNLRIKFASVEESRCPRNVTCVWAGNAQVLIEVGTRNGRGKSMKLNTMGSPQLPSEGKYKSYTVTLVEVNPYPQDGQEIAAGDYAVTLVVSKE
jgi:hypothetical protein